MMMEKFKDPLPSSSSGDFAPLIPPTPFRYASRIYDQRCAGGGWLAGDCGFEGRDGGGDRIFAGRFAVSVVGGVSFCKRMMMEKFKDPPPLIPPPIAALEGVG